MRDVQYLVLLALILLLMAIAFTFGQFWERAEAEKREAPAVTAMNRIADECYLYAQEKK